MGDDTFYIGRQPIFNTHMRVFGYELLFRSGLDNYFPNVNPDYASSSTIVNSFFLTDVNQLTGGKKIFLNLTEKTLKEDIVSILPKDKIIIELLETIQPNAEVYERCKYLRDAGYTLALDDFVLKDEWKPFLEFIDIIKIDFLQTQGNKRLDIVRKLSKNKIKFLAEKVETMEDFEEAVEAGYEFFQGYFFSKPVIVQTKRIPENKLYYLKILKEITKPDFDFSVIEGYIKRDMSLSYKLLKFINSAYFGIRNEVHSIIQALALLGSREIKRWISLVALSIMSEDKSTELMNIAVIRGRFCEETAVKLRMDEKKEDYFLLGMFSLADVFLDRPMSEILQELNLEHEIKETLMGKPGKMRNIFDLCVAYEQAEWDAVDEKCSMLSLKQSELTHTYKQSVCWTYELLNDERL